MSLFKTIAINTRPVMHQRRGRPWYGAYPRKLETLQRYCPQCKRRLGMEVPMQLIGRLTADNGQPMAVMACSLCNLRQGWTLDVYTGSPHLLWPRKA